MKTIKSIFIFSIALLCASCDYLDIVPDNVATIEYAFRNRSSALQYLHTCYSYRPKIGSISDDPAMFGADETWQRYSTQNMWATFESSLIARGYQTSSNPYMNFWDGWGNTALWVGIRDCNIFLEGVGGVIELTDYERKRWIAEANFLKAYYHYYLFRSYGPVPIIDVNLPVTTDEISVKVHHEPVDKIVAYITDLLLKAASDLPDPSEIKQGTEAGRADKLMAMGLRAEVLLFAASPLFNGNKDYAGMIDNRGVSLFPQTYDENKWKVAAEACKEAIDLCHQHGKELYNLLDPLTMSPEIPEVFKIQTTFRQAICDRWNKELIWGNTHYNVFQLAQYATPRLERLSNRINDATSEFAPTLKLVEKFYSSNGVPIEEDTEWLTNGWYENRFAIRNESSSGDEKYYVKEGEQTVYLHYNRDVRFYASLGFDKGIYFGSGYYKFPDNVKHCDFLNLQVSGYQGGSGYSPTGYASKKLHSFKNTMSQDANLVEFFPFPVLRLADLYLMYAEALNETSGPSDEIFQYLDLIRKRAGLEGVRESWSKYSSRPDKPESKDGLREIIHRERTVELALEGKRFWDIRRWKKIEELNEQPKGWNIMGETKEDFYRISLLAELPVRFSVKDYFWPIKESNLNVNENLIQNYGW